MGQIRIIIVAILFVMVLGAPFLFRKQGDAPVESDLRLVIISPHVEHLRYEFARGFSEWHEAKHGVPVVVDWRRPGGTSEIRKQLLSQYGTAVRNGRIEPDGSCETGSMPFDLMFGGGSYEFNVMKRGVTATLPDGEEVAVPILTRAPFTESQLDDWYGPNRIGRNHLYDPDRFWFGTALSGFGIAYNRRVLDKLGLPEPTEWADLTAPRYQGWLALADPRQSGSVTTTYESILDGYGWERGWRTLRLMAANARYFSASSARVVIDVSHGEAAAALAIDFYGRYEAEATRRPGQGPEESRVGYIDPPGLVMIDPDPVAMLRGGPSPELAARFIEYTLSRHGQSLWQFPPKGEDASTEVLGPRRFALRRMPIRRDLYDDEAFFSGFMDKIRMYDVAADLPSSGWRSMIGPVFGALGVDTHGALVRAWIAINDARTGGAPESFIAEIESVLHSMPMHEFADGSTALLSPEHYAAIREDWRDPDRAVLKKLGYNEFFRSQYERVVNMVREAGY